MILAIHTFFNISFIIFSILQCFVSSLILRSFPSVAVIYFWHVSFLTPAQSRQTHLQYLRLQRRELGLYTLEDDGVFEQHDLGRDDMLSHLLVRHVFCEDRSMNNVRLLPRTARNLPRGRTYRFRVNVFGHASILPGERASPRLSRMRMHRNGMSLNIMGMLFLRSTPRISSFERSLAFSSSEPGKIYTMLQVFFSFLAYSAVFTVYVFACLRLVYARASTRDV